MVKRCTPAKTWYHTAKRIGCLSHLTPPLEMQSKLQMAESHLYRDLLAHLQIQQGRLTKIFMPLLFHGAFSSNHSCAHQDLAGFYLKTPYVDMKQPSDFEVQSLSYQDPTQGRILN